ncbi:MAG TPA: hypothetical protein VFB62_17330 [Polyangiaceae bacterium]|nr:hypothetical protein [Polyangiaceae bacterium]
MQTLNLAGSAARFGGGAARFVGWSVLVLGLAMALGIGLLLQTLFPGGFAGLAIGLPIAIASLFFGIAAIVGGGKLHQSGVKKRRAAELQTIQALAAHHKGVVTAADAARALDMDETRADALLTELARDPKQGVCLDLDDDGRLLYLFGGEELNPRWRIAEQPLTTDKEHAEAEAEAELEPLERQRR